MQKEKWFRLGIGILLLFLIILIGTKIKFIFTPLVIIVQTLLPPIILAGILYFLLRPIVNWMSKKMPRTIAILIVFVALASLITGAILLIGPELQKQFTNLLNNIPKISKGVQEWALSMIQSDWFKSFQANEIISIEKITTQLESSAQELLQTAGAKIANTIGFIANMVMIFALVPFVLFFMLKDGENATKFLGKLLPKRHEKEANAIIDEMDEALSSYIQGQLLVSLFVGVLAYIGYLIIGLDYALVLGVLAMVTNVIPFLGPWIGTFPAVIVGLFTSPIQALLVIIVAVVVQQIESNLISPLVMGKALNMHPLTIIFVLLVAGQFGGLLGLIFAVPVYALLKVIITHSYRYIRLD